MKIELNAGGLVGINIAMFQSNVSELNEEIEDVISAFQTVKQRVYNMSGGVGNLQGAIDDIQNRINMEERKKQALATVSQKATNFFELTLEIDTKVHDTISSREKKFYEDHPHLKPPDPPEEKGFIEKAKDWCINQAENLKKAWDGLVEWYTENKETIKKIITTTLIVVGSIIAIAAIVYSGGTLLAPLLAAFGMAEGVATTVSMVVGTVAVVSSAVSLVPNGMDCAAAWDEIIDPNNNPITDANNELHSNENWNTFQNVTNTVSDVSNFVYNIGAVYEVAQQFKSVKTFKNQGGYSSLEKKCLNSNISDESRKYMAVTDNLKRNNGILRADDTGKRVILEKMSKNTPRNVCQGKIIYINDGTKNFDNIRIVATKSIPFHKIFKNPETISKINIIMSTNNVLKTLNGEKKRLKKVIDDFMAFNNREGSLENAT